MWPLSIQLFSLQSFTTQQSPCVSLYICLYNSLSLKFHKTSTNSFHGSRTINNRRNTQTTQPLFFLRKPPYIHRSFPSISKIQRLPTSKDCFVVEERKQSSPMDDDNKPESTTSSSEILMTSRLLKKAEKKKSERFTYLIAAVMSSFGITSMAIMAVYYRFSWQMKVNYNK